MSKKITFLVVVVSLYLAMTVQAANIIFVSDQYDDSGDGIPDDQAWVDLLIAKGYKVDYTMGREPGNGYWQTLDDSKIAKLNAADLVIVSQNTNSGAYDDGEEPTQWNSITTPIILLSTHLARRGRWTWVNSTSMSDLDVPMNVSKPNHPMFAGVTLDENNEFQAMDATVGQILFINNIDIGNGTLIALPAGSDAAWIITWNPGVEFYPSAGQFSGGPRMYFAAGTLGSPGMVGRGEMNLTPEGQKVFLNAVDLYVPSPGTISDVTSPGDPIRGFPDNGNWPGNEAPQFAIDNQSSTKFLHFDGDSEPSGFQITPAGPSIVTELTLVTANDVAGRDPITFELYGSNNSVDEPYELIVSGDIVDFAQESAWPRLTKNKNPILFDNEIAYLHYQLIFPTIRGPVGGAVNSMQIAEVELLGTWIRARTPANGAINIENYVLKWSAGSTYSSYDVHLSTDPTFENSDFVINTKLTQWPVDLEPATTYYWRVDEIQTDGTMFMGSVWSFTTAGPARGLKGKYFRGTNFETLVLTRIDPQIDFDLGSGRPDPLVNADLFSVRWTGEVTAQFSETYTFHTTSDDGVRLWVDGQLLIDNWTDHARTDDTGSVDLVKGQTYSIVMEMYENGGDAVALLRWSSARTPLQLVPVGYMQPQFDVGVISLIDDFDTYTNTSGLTDFWIDGSGIDDNGATISLEGTLVIMGDAMAFQYDNTDGVLVSRASRTFEEPQNWASGGANALSFFVLGDPDNNPSIMYLGVTDGQGNVAEVPIGDPNFVNRDDWIEIIVPLSGLSEAGVNVENIESMSVAITDPAVLVGSDGLIGPGGLIRSSAVRPMQSSNAFCGSNGQVIFDNWTTVINTLFLEEHGWVAGYVYEQSIGDPPIPDAMVTLTDLGSGAIQGVPFKTLSCGFYWLWPPVGQYQVNVDPPDIYVSPAPVTVTVTKGIPGVLVKPTNFSLPLK